MPPYFSPHESTADLPRYLPIAINTSPSPHHSTEQQKKTHCSNPPFNLPSMTSVFAVLMALVSVVPGMLAQYLTRPALEVPACPTTGSVSYNTSVPDGGLFPLTQVDLCYDDSSIHINFTAYEEKDFYCMPISSTVLRDLILPSLFSLAPC